MSDLAARNCVPCKGGVPPLRGAALLRVLLDTGRTHQIRVQLAEAGFPVLGDAVYGAPADAIARQALHTPVAVCVCMECASNPMLWTIWL